jgi:MscS family membrane protein
MSLIHYGYLAAAFIASFMVGRIAGPVMVAILELATRGTKSTLDDRVIAAIKVPLESFFFLAVFYLLLNSFPELESAASFLDEYTAAIIILIAAFMVSEASGAAIRWYYDEGHRGARMVKMDLTLLPLVRKVTKVAVYVVGITLALSTTGFDVTGILAVTSVAGLILGLASQETLANIFAGLALQLDRPYHYGDYLKLPSGEIAKLDKIGMRTTRLSDMSHNLIILSNSEFAKLRLTNLSLPDEICLVPVSAELPSSANLDVLKKKLASALARKKPKGLMPELGYTLLIDSVKPSTVAFTFSFWVKRYQNAPEIMEIVRREMLAFSRAKKKLP